MRLFICGFLLVIVVSMSVHIIIFIRKTNLLKNEYLKELYKIKDYETLYKIGEMNYLGKKEKRRVPLLILSDWLEKKYCQTNNEIYDDLDILFSERNAKFFKAWLVIGFSLIAVFIIYYLD
jgi:hypothetical protein